MKTLVFSALCAFLFALGIGSAQGTVPTITTNSNGQLVATFPTNAIAKVDTGPKSIGAQWEGFWRERQLDLNEWQFFVAYLVTEYGKYWPFALFGSVVLVYYLMCWSPVGPRVRSR